MIYIKDVIVSGVHGVHEHEKKAPQPFSVSLQVNFDTTRAGTSDDLDDTLDWSWLRRTIVQTVEQQSFNLVERLAQAIGEAIMVDERINAVTVTVDKLQAFESGVPGVTVTLNRS